MLNGMDIFLKNWFPGDENLLFLDQGAAIR